MALFKMRKGGDESPATPRPESVEAMRKRARHRLIGAAVLVLLGVLGFPVLFDTQPRPISVDIPIEIPDRNKVKPLAAPSAAPSAVQAPAVSGPVTAPPMTAPPVTAPPLAAPPAVAAVTPAAVPQPSMATAPESPASKPQSAAKPEPQSDAKASAKPDTATGDGARALALLEGKAVSAAAASEGRFVVQVGAFADAAKAREVRRKVERAGLKTYTHVAETKEGKRIRVRVGPFDSRTDADKAAGKLKGLDLPAAILTL